MSLKLAVCGALFASLCASVQGQTPVDKTPVLHLSFDNVSGTTVINDGFGGSAMNGTLNGTATIVSGGKFGNCLSITGADSSQRFLPHRKCGGAAQCRGGQHLDGGHVDPDLHAGRLLCLSR